MSDSAIPETPAVTRALSGCTGLVATMSDRTGLAEGVTLQ